MPKPNNQEKKTINPLIRRFNNQWADPINDRSDFFKAEFGKKYRVHLLQAPYGKRVHFIPGANYVQSDSQWSDDFRKCIERGELDNYVGSEPDMRYVCPIVVFETDSKGQINGPASKVNVTVQPWVLPKSTYEKVFNIAQEWGSDFLNQDLILSVAKKGNMVFVDTATVASKGTLLADKSIAARIEQEFDKEKYEDMDYLDKLLGQTLTLGQLQERLNNKSDDENSDKETNRKGRKRPEDV